MELGAYNRGNVYYHEKRHRLFGKKTFLFLIFLSVVGFVFITSFTPKGITGNVVENINLNNSFSVFIETEIPEVNLNGVYPQVIVEGIIGSELVFGYNKILLKDYRSKLEIYNFSGKINFDEEEIHFFDGKASTIVLNGVPISGDSDKGTKFSLLMKTNENSFAFVDDIYIKNFDFVTSGSVDLSNDRINLNQENLKIKDFFGEIRISENKFFAEGSVKELEISGKSKTVKVKN